MTPPKIAIEPMSDGVKQVPHGRIMLARFFLAIGATLALFALLIVAGLVASSVNHTYEGGVQAIGTVILFVLFAAPATLFCGVAVALRGWREARAGYIIVACLYGLPLLLFLAGIILAIYDSLRAKFAA